MPFTVFEAGPRREGQEKAGTADVALISAVERIRALAPSSKYGRIWKPQPSP